MRKKKRYKKTPWKDLIAKGDDRINQIQLYVRQKYRHIRNLLVFPHFGRGTGTDIIVASHGNKILEVREVTNWQRFAKNGQPISNGKLPVTFSLAKPSFKKQKFLFKPH